jgi:hypothetical protein
MVLKLDALLSGEYKVRVHVGNLWLARERCHLTTDDI